VTESPATAESSSSSRVEARRAATRDLILDAAWTLAREVGLTGFSLRELAGRVGMRAPSLYEYFAGKDAIYDAMYAQGNHRFLEAVSDPPDTEAVDAREALAAGASAFLDFATDDPVRFQLLFQRSIAGWEPSPEAYAPALEAYAVMQRHLTAIGATEQRDHDLWTALVSGLAHQQIANDPEGRRWHDLVDDTVDLYLTYLEGRRPDGRP
jgi:AcrR family transcriptional regulator